MFGFSLYRGYSEAQARTLTFARLVLRMLGLVFVNRSRSHNLWRALRLPNRAVWWVVVGALSFLAGVIYIPQARAIFRCTELEWTDLLIAIGAGGVVVLSLEIAKFLRRESAPSPKDSLDLILSHFFHDPSHRDGKGTPVVVRIGRILNENCYR
jgi:P-type Ca2+ transporter type 2C